MRKLITIVSGLPRSGTSMMMKILEAGGIPVLVDNIRAADVDNPNGYYEFEPVKSTAENSSWLSQARGKVVKMIYKLLYDLPEGSQCRIVFMQRALKEVIASQNAMLRRRGEKPSSAERSHALVSTFASEVAACKRWLKTRENFDVVYVNYNKILADPADEISRLNEFFGNELNQKAMLRVVDPALYRKRS